METKEKILSLVRQYHQKFPLENEDAKPLMQFVTDHEGDALINRKNFTGHLTASAFIVNKNADALLLLKHKSLSRWLQPGGHIDATDASFEAAALREANEETGLGADSLLQLSNAIFDIDSHVIPANNKKQEPQHIHHDVRFLFQYSGSQALNISLEESIASRWVSFKELSDNEDFYWIEEKVKAALELK